MSDSTVRRVIVWKSRKALNEQEKDEYRLSYFAQGDKIILPWPEHQAMADVEKAAEEWRDNPESQTLEECVNDALDALRKVRGGE